MTTRAPFVGGGGMGVASRRVRSRARGGATSAVATHAMLICTERIVLTCLAAGEHSAHLLSSSTTSASSGKNRQIRAVGRIDHQCDSSTLVLVCQAPRTEQQKLGLAGCNTLAQLKLDRAPAATACVRDWAGNSAGGKPSPSPQHDHRTSAPCKRACSAPRMSSRGKF